MKAPRSAFLSWLHQHYRGVLFLLVVGAAVLFRFWRLTTLPHGLSPVEAAAGLEALHPRVALGDFSLLTGWLFNLMQFLSIKVLGNSALALRVVPALLGVVSVMLCYQLVKSWFGRRVAVLTALLLAVTPWSVTLSRTGVSSSIIPFWLVLSLWLVTRALQKGSIIWFLLAGLTLGSGVYVDGIWWFAVAAILFASVPAVFFRNRLGVGSKQFLLAAVALLAALLPAITSTVLNPKALGQLFSQLPATTRILDGLARVAAMFNLNGDDSYIYNLGGLPMLNFFVGVMFIVGLLIILGQLRRTKYMLLFLLLIVGMLPAAITGRADAARGAITLLPALVLAAIGINYMLERWYQTFPINAAARSAGLSAIVFVLAMTVYQGYNHYFIAWAQTRAMHEAHAEGAVAMAKYLKESVYEGKQYVLLEPQLRPTLQYLATGVDYQMIELEQVDGLTDETAQFVISYSLENEAVKKLRVKYPKARLTPYLSDFSNNQELFSVFEVRK
jgi:hypothetical protein